MTKKSHRALRANPSPLNAAANSQKCVHFENFVLLNLRDALFFFEIPLFQRFPLFSFHCIVFWSPGDTGYVFFCDGFPSPNSSTSEEQLWWSLCMTVELINA